jgi:hypothetical protein
MTGLWPPISSCTRFADRDAFSRIPRPVSVDPVKEIASTPSCSTIAAPTLLPAPITTLTTPAGIPALSRASIRRSPVRAASSASFSTTVLPKTRAGASFHVGIAAGKFQGVMIPITPTGLRRVNNQV